MFKHTFLLCMDQIEKPIRKLHYQQRAATLTAQMPCLEKLGSYRLFRPQNLYGRCTVDRAHNISNALNANMCIHGIHAEIDMFFQLLILVATDPTEMTFRYRTDTTFVLEVSYNHHSVASSHVDCTSQARTRMQREHRNWPATP